VTAAALEIHDAGLLLIDESDPARPRTPPSPGYALIDGQRLLTGIEAALAARLKPRCVQHRFWCDLETVPLKHPLFRNYSAADLAHAHLSELWRSARPGTSSVWIAAPGTMTDRQLGLLVGIARACGVGVDGMVDAAVAGCSERARPPRVLHLDLELHRAVLTEIEVGDELVRRRVAIDDAIGVIPLQDRWMKQVADKFVRKTRFDPFHSAASEQALHRQLRRWLAAPDREDTARLELEARQRKYSIKLDPDEMIGFVEDQYSRLVNPVDRMVEGEPATVMLSDRAAALPGLAGRLGGAPESLPVGAAAAGALRHRSQLGHEGDELLFVTRLSVREPRDAQA
jgi:hypothetical protein